MIKRLVAISVLSVLLFVSSNVVFDTSSSGSILVSASDVAVEFPQLEEVLYHKWEESTDPDFVYETSEEYVTESMLAGADEYVIESYSYDESGNLIIYWQTDYMYARLVAYADRDYRYMEANYVIEDTNDYDSDTLYFRR